MDRVFEPDNHTLMHLEFQSTREPNLYRFLGYAVALTLQYRQPVRTVVIYLCKAAVDILERLDLGSLDYAVTPISILETSRDRRSGIGFKRCPPRRGRNSMSWT